MKQDVTLQCRVEPSLGVVDTYLESISAEAVGSYFKDLFTEGRYDGVAVEVDADGNALLEPGFIFMLTDGHGVYRVGFKETVKYPVGEDETLHIQLFDNPDGSKGVELTLDPNGVSSLEVGTRPGVELFLDAPYTLAKRATGKDFTLTFDVFNVGGVSEKRSFCTCPVHGVIKRAFFVPETTQPASVNNLALVNEDSSEVVGEFPLINAVEGIAIELPTTESVVFQVGDPFRVSSSDSNLTVNGSITVVIAQGSTFGF